MEQMAMLYRIEGGDYVGEMQNGKREGKGVFTYYLPDKETYWTYDGDWKDDLKHGQGTYYFMSNGRKTGEYVGRWARDLYHGMGREVYYGDTSARIWQYEGMYDKGRKHGSGHIIFFEEKAPHAKRMEYIGGWSDNVREGSGKCIAYLLNGQVSYLYEGEWKKDFRHGKGHYIECINGHKHVEYLGKWKNDRRHGKGRQVHHERNVVFRYRVWYKMDELRQAEMEDVAGGFSEKLGAIDQDSR